ncbi:hypothetical protein [Streptomyces sp. NPDC002908]|uniref:hypothetical protein n=1 Tax=Streptomyces sp. NPDC002908 TaxID=3364670 RepID=UPI0036A40FBA
MFFGWLWGMGWPLEPTQEFRGGDAFTAELASDETVSEMRSNLLGEAVADGMDAPSAKAATRFRYKDVGPDPGSPWYKANSIRGAVMDLSGVLTNGGIGTENYADAFLGSYSGTGKIKSVDREKGVVLLEFKVKNISDWNSATHAVPRHEKNPPNIYGASVAQKFSWQERLPLNMCGCWVE